MNHKEKYSMTEYFDIAIDNGALLLDASNLDWLTFPLYSCIRNEIHRQVDLRTIDFDWGYNSPGGKDELKELIAKHESHIEKTTIDKDEIVLTGNGTTGALNYVLQCILKLNHFNTGIKVMYGVPSYDGFDRALDFYEFKPVQILLQKNKDYICLEATISLIKGNSDEIMELIDERKKRRVETQPLEYPSAGSTFKRPEGYFAGKLVQDAGLAGYTVGGACVSEKHCGFVINKGNATAQDVLDVIEHTRNEVKRQFGVELEPEVRIVTKITK